MKRVVWGVGLGVLALVVLVVGVGPWPRKGGAAVLGGRGEAPNIAPPTGLVVPGNSATSARLNHVSTGQRSEVTDHLAAASAETALEAGLREGREAPSRNAVGPAREDTSRPTGAISGRVFADSGAPIELARLWVGSTENTVLGRYEQTYSDADGFYRFEDVSEGEWFVTALAVGHVVGTVASVSVAGGEETAGVDLVLADAPVLYGRVVDETGDPIAGARVLGRPQGGGWESGASTEPDGSFGMLLLYDEPHRLEVTREGFVPHGQDSPSSERFYAPDADDIHIELRRGS